MEFKDRKVTYGVLCGSVQSAHFEYFEGVSEHGVIDLQENKSLIIKYKIGLFTIGWVGQIWHWQAPAGIKTQYSHKSSNLSTSLSGNTWH